MTTTGWELEVSAGAVDLLNGLRHYGLTGHTRQHAYHCECADCQPRPWFGPDQKWFKMQNDCTANGECISGIFEYGSDEMNQAILGQGHVLLKGRNIQCQGNVGNHVHVSREGLDNAGSEASLRLSRMFGRYAIDLSEIAAGPRDAMRGYNGRLEVPAATDPLWSRTTENYPGSTLSYNGAVGHCLTWKSRTVEFRLWNSVKAPWRIRTHVGLSVAMVEAAIAGQDATHGDVRALEDVIGDFIDADTWAGILRQRYSKGGIQNA